MSEYVSPPESANRSSLKATAEDTTTYLSDDRRATISRWMKGNPKLGPGVYSYSRLPGRPFGEYDPAITLGTCPGSSAECEDICYAKRIVNADVLRIYEENSLTWELPSLPSDAKIVRFHVSGDFDTEPYIFNWVRLCQDHPDVRFWGYTRSWCIRHLLPLLEELRALPNVQLFASVDNSIKEEPPAGWRRAYIQGDERITDINGEIHPTDAYVCPEETGRKKDCISCGYCILGRHGNVAFLKH